MKLKFFTIITFQICVLNGLTYLMGFFQDSNYFSYNQNLYKYYFLAYFIIQIIFTTIIIIRVFFLKKALFGMLVMNVVLMVILFTLLLMIPKLSLIYLGVTVAYLYYLLKIIMFDREVYKKFTDLNTGGHLLKCLSKGKKIVFIISTSIYFGIFNLFTIYSDFHIHVYQIHNQSTKVLIFPIIGLWISGIWAYDYKAPTLNIDFIKKMIINFNIVIDIACIGYIVLCYNDFILYFKTIYKMFLLII